MLGKAKLSLRDPKDRRISDSEKNLFIKAVSYKNWNRELFSLLRLNFKFIIDHNRVPLGTYGGNTITINSKYSFNMWDTMVHEIGHAWHHQLCDIGDMNLDREAMKVVRDTAKYLGWDITLGTWYEARDFLWEEISQYATEGWWEAFAEIFMWAYCDIDEEYGITFEKQNACREAIEGFNSRFIVAYWKTSNCLTRL